MEACGIRVLCPAWTRLAGFTDEAGQLLTVALCTAYDANHISDSPQGPLPDGVPEEERARLASSRCSVCLIGFDTSADELQPILLYCVNGRLVNYQDAGFGPYTDEWWDAVVRELFERGTTPAFPSGDYFVWGLEDEV